MTRIVRNHILSALIGGALLSFCGSAIAQSTKAEAADPEVYDKLQSPEFSGVNQKSGFKPKNWIEIEAKIRLPESSQAPSQTTEKLSVRWFVAVKNPDRPNTLLLLSKEVDHVNVPLNEDVYVSIYLSPSSVKRLTGSDQAAKGIVELAGYEILINGAIVAEKSNKSKPGWWNTASQKISRSDIVPLLKKPQTPFSHMWWDRYAEVAQPDAR